MRFVKFDSTCQGFCIHRQTHKFLQGTGCPVGRNLEVEEGRGGEDDVFVGCKRMQY